MFTPAFFKIVKKWKKPKCSSTDEWVSKMWYIHRTEYYSAIKKSTMCYNMNTP